MAELNVISNDPNKMSKLQEIKIVLPQILAASAVSSLSIILGLATAYSAILIPQLTEGERQGDVDSINMTKSEAVWFTSSIGLVMPIGSVISGLMTDNFGRIKVLRLSALPHIIGWTIIALANNTSMLLVGRVITGFGATLVIIPSFVYISEISSPRIRGALLSIASPFYNTGMLLIYLKGWVFNWRIIAWSIVGYSVVTLLFILFIPESPLWLKSKHKLNAAQNSLKWLHRYEFNYKNERYEDATPTRQKEIKKTSLREMIVSTLKEFVKPTVYKPFILMALLMMIQQFSGIHVIMMNAVTFFNGIGTKFDPYLASIYMSSMKLFITIIQIWFMKKFCRRILLMISCLGMASSMIMCAMWTKWIQEGSTVITWVPLCMLILYFLFLSGLSSIPLAITSELFPLSVRGLASNLVGAFTCFMLFAALQSFDPLCNLFGGLYGIQYFYGAVTVFGFIFVFVFIPETHNKDLSNMQTYFENYSVYMLAKRKLNVSEK